MTLPVYSRSYQMLEPPYMLKKAKQICQNFEWAADSKNKLLLPNASPYVTSFTSTILL